MDSELSIVRSKQLSPAIVGKDRASVEGAARSVVSALKHAGISGPSFELEYDAKDRSYKAVVHWYAITVSPHTKETIPATGKSTFTVSIKDE